MNHSGYHSTNNISQMVEVYSIISLVNGDIYVGMALNSERRLKEHNSGRNRYTKGLRPWKLFQVEFFPDWKQARFREKYLKSGVGKEYLKMLVRSSASDLEEGQLVT